MMRISFLPIDPIIFPVKIPAITWAIDEILAIMKAYENMIPSQEGEMPFSLASPGKKGAWKA